MDRADRPAAATVAVTAFVSALAALALVFAHAYGSQRFADHALTLQRAEALLGTATSSGVLLEKALLVEEARSAGLADQASAVAARGALVEALLSLERQQEELGDLAGQGGGRDAVGELVAAGMEVVALLEQGETSEARQAAMEMEPQYRLLLAEVLALRNQAAERVAAADGTAGRVADLARFLVAFVLPLSALLLLRDIMRRRFRQRELEALLEAEREISASKDRFIANVSHELRTPLTSIYGLSRVLEEEGFDDPETALDFVNLIIGESSELSRIVDDLLTAARADAGVLSFELSNVSVRDEIEGVVASFNRSGSAIEVNCEPVEVVADPMRLRQVIRNLVANARRHGGANVKVLGAARDGWFVCTVCDDGPGVPPEVAGRLFERFSQTGEAAVQVAGIGIGLSIVKMLVGAMGGSVSYQRQENETRFVVRLPLAAESASPLRLTSPATGNLHLRGLPSLRSRPAPLELDEAERTLPIVADGGG